MIFNHVISIVRPRRVRSSYGGLTDDWDNPEIIPVMVPVSVQPVSSTEVEGTGRRLSTQSRFRLFTKPPHLLEDVRSTDRIRVEGWARDLDIIGEPGHWRTTILPHSEIELEDRHG